MQGADAAVTFVMNYLESDLPARMVRYRNAWNLDDIRLPLPASYWRFEADKIAWDDYPVCSTICLSTNRISRVDYDSWSNPEYRVEYTMRTYLYVGGDGEPYGIRGEELTTKMVRDLTTVVRSALLDHQCLKYRDDDGDLDVRIDESSIREEFSELTYLKGDRFMAASYIGYTVHLNEVVTRIPLAASAQYETVYESL
jgi:hypothetical protein